MIERSLVIVKPDGVQRGLIGEILKRFEMRGCVLRAGKFMQVSAELASAHYQEHADKPFYNGLVKYITSAPVFVMIVESEDGVRSVRQTVGVTNPVEAAPGTIRHDLAAKRDRNLVHASDSVENAQKEIALWFKTEEIIEWEPCGFDWRFGSNS